MNPEPVPAGSAVRARAGLKPLAAHAGRQRGAGTGGFETRPYKLRPYGAYSPPTISEVCSVAMTTDLTSL